MMGWLPLPQQFAISAVDIAEVGLHGLKVEFVAVGAGQGQDAAVGDDYRFVVGQGGELVGADAAAVDFADPAVAVAAIVNSDKTLATTGVVIFAGQQQCVVIDQCAVCLLYTSPSPRDS